MDIRDSQIPLPDPRYWGSRFWFVMHTVAYFFPDAPTTTEMEDAKRFYEYLRSLLPCPGCAAHYAELLRTHPVERAISSRMALIEWVILIHNEVNRKLGKPIVSVEEYFMSMRHLEAPKGLTVEPIVLAIIAGLFVIAILRQTFFKAATS